ncbi:MAG: hypothetical protein QY322_01055 [bacterium]|nr:MAG: hypothetical protein QY322_01055 [bacterium]
MIESINSIHPGDGTRELNWSRACKAIPSLLAQGAVDLSSHGIKISQGALGLVAVDGNHRLARVLQLVGPSLSVAFHLDEENEEIADTLISEMNKNDVTDFHKFLQMCEKRQFIRPHNETL